MHAFNVLHEAKFDAKQHVEKILAAVADGDVTVACWEPGQISPYHCHPHATEIYLCFEGGGTMRTRYFDLLEGVTPEAKELAKKAAAATGLSVHQWLDRLVHKQALEDLQRADEKRGE